MLSYHHQFHAGNLADIQKHLHIIAAIELMQKKEKPISFIDSHAGAGLYDLHSDEAQKTGEAEAGILSIQAHLEQSSNPLLQHYRTRIEAQQTGEKQITWQYYPGSPNIALELLRPQDDWIGLELHSTTFALLQQHTKSYPSAHLHQRDAFEALPALIPTRHARALLIVDPSYEVKTDYREIAKLLHTLRKKMRQLVILLWYPILPEGQHLELLEPLFTLPYLHDTWQNPALSTGMLGTGMLTINPPWQLESILTTAYQSLFEAPTLATYEQSFSSANL